MAWVALGVCSVSTFLRWSLTIITGSSTCVPNPSSDSAELKRAGVVEESWLLVTSTVLLALSSWASTFHNDDCSMLTLIGCFRDWPMQKNSPQMTMTLSIFLGWYLHCIAKNFVPGIGLHSGKDMVGHHFLTIGLLGAGHYFGVQRAGLLVLALLNISSPFMHAAKIVYNLGNLKLLRAVLFIMFAAAFGIARCILFPKLIVSICLEVAAALHRNQPGVVLPAFICLSGLGALQVLQFFWMWKILKIIIRGGTDTSKSHQRKNTSSDDKKQLKSYPLPNARPGSREPSSTSSPATISLAEAELETHSMTSPSSHSSLDDLPLFQSSLPDVKAADVPSSPLRSCRERRTTT